MVLAENQVAAEAHIEDAILARVEVKAGTKLGADDFLIDPVLLF